MRNYVIINGVNSLTIQGLAINNLPPITKPMIRTQREEIDGRDGDIVTELGYSAYDKQIEIGLWGNYDINDIIKYFTGEGTIVFSNEEDKYYNFKILDQIDYEKLLKFKTATITLHCQPFKYPLEEEPVEAEIVTISGEGESITLNNTEEAPMKIDLKGNTSQEGTPTPETPQDIHVVSGDNEIQVCGKNLLEINSISGTMTTGVNYTFNNSEMVLNGTATTYEPYQGNTYPINLPSGMELCKIGNYQDYIYKDNGKWYVKKEIGKVIFTGTSDENWVFQSGSVWKYRIGINNSLLSTSDTQPPMVLSNYYKAGIWNNSANYQMGSLPSISSTLAVRNDDITSLDNWKTWLSTHNTIVYYPLATPTYTEITDSTLISQLNLLEQAQSKDNQTNISQVNNDLPFELDVSVTFVVPMEINNIGNIYAKPILTIEGTGNIGVVLNDIQILEIDLTNNGKIAIDVTKLEAYNPDDDTLLNRLVTGDYMKLLINEGENTITFTGSVSSATLTNYIRWI